MKKLINISLSEIKINELTKLKSEALIVSFYESKKLSDITDIFDTGSTTGYWSHMRKPQYEA